MAKSAGGAGRVGRGGAASGNIAGFDAETSAKIVSIQARIKSGDVSLKQVRDELRTVNKDISRTEDAIAKTKLAARRGNLNDAVAARQINSLADAERHITSARNSPLSRGPSSTATILKSEFGTLEKNRVRSSALEYLLKQAKK